VPALKPKEVPLAATVEIAPRTEAELALLFGLAKGAFVDLPGWSDRRVLEVLRRDVTFVAREHGQPAGYVALRRKEGGAIVVEQLFVAPGHEQRGIGHRLLAYAEGYAIAERARSLQIVVEEGNQQARSFYRRSGFVPVEPELFELVLPRAD
jgi:ribosomal protein S18 acetylase RimI-like enzyme